MPTVKLPGVGPVDSRVVYGLGAVAAGFVAYMWVRAPQGAPPSPVGEEVVEERSGEGGAPWGLAPGAGTPEVGEPGIGPPTTNAEWGRRVLEALVDLGTDPSFAGEALGAYLTGNPLTLAQRAAIQTGIALVGPAPVAPPPVKEAPPAAAPPAWYGTQLDAGDIGRILRTRAISAKIARGSATRAEREWLTAERARAGDHGGYTGQSLARQVRNPIRVGTPTWFGTQLDSSDVVRIERLRTLESKIRGRRASRAEVREWNAAVTRHGTHGGLLSGRKY